MAVDKKSQYGGGHQAYTDNDGMRRNFVMIDHDVKTKIGTTNIDSQKAKEELKASKQGLVERLLAIHPSVCPQIFHDFTIRGEEGISWNETMLRDEGLDMQKLIDIHTMCKNKLDLKGIIS